MSVVEPLTQADAGLAADVLAHLQVQLTSVARLLQIVLEQGAAIRRRDVKDVVTLTGVLQGELARRQLLEEERGQLLQRAGVRLGIAPTAVTLSALTTLMDADTAPLARERSAQLRGMLEEVQREHRVNRALMHQELAFLDHLLRLAGATEEFGYDAAGERPPPARKASRHRVFDLEV